MGNRFEDERTFFTRPRREFLEREVFRLKGAYVENVPAVFIADPFFRAVPKAVKETLFSLLTQDKRSLIEQADKLLRGEYRFPEEIDLTQVVEEERRLSLTNSWGIIDRFTRKVIKGKHVYSCGILGKPAFVNLYNPDDPETAINITLNSYNCLPRWSNAFAIHGFIDEEGFRNNDDYNGKGKDMFVPYRNPDGSVASYSLFYKGDRIPITPWHLMLNADFDLIDALVRKVLLAIDAYDRTELKVDFN